MSTISNELKYLFGVRYFDGSEFYQTQEDKSTTKENGSAFSDVIQDQVHIFCLIRQSDQKQFEVNLQNGLFAVHGEVIDLAPMSLIAGPRKLIYFREVLRHQDIKATVEEDMSVTAEEAEVRTEFGRYMIGWEAPAVSGPNVKVMLGVR